MVTVATLQCYSRSSSALKVSHFRQLSALAISTIGRGPSCLHKLLVHTPFEIPDCVLMLREENLDGELGYYLKRIEEGDVSRLVDANIVPSKDLIPNLSKN